MVTVVSSILSKLAYIQRISSNVARALKEWFSVAKNWIWIVVAFLVLILIAVPAVDAFLHIPTGTLDKVRNWALIASVMGGFALALYGTVISRLNLEVSKESIGRAEVRAGWQRATDVRQGRLDL